MYKKIGVVAVAILSSVNYLAAASPHGVQSVSAHSHIITSTHGVSCSRELVVLLQDLATSLTVSDSSSPLVKILEAIDSGITMFDITVLDTALKQAVQVLASSGGRLSPITVVEYMGILAEALEQISAAGGKRLIKKTHVV